MKKIIFLTLLSVMFAGSAYGGLILEAQMDGSGVDTVGGAAVTTNPSGSPVFGTPAQIGQALQPDLSSQPGLDYDVADITTGEIAVSV